VASPFPAIAPIGLHQTPQPSQATDVLETPQQPPQAASQAVTPWSGYTRDDAERLGGTGGNKRAAEEVIEQDDSPSNKRANENEDREGNVCMEGQGVKWWLMTEGSEERRLAREAAPKWFEMPEGEDKEAATAAMQVENDANSVAMVSSMRNDNEMRGGGISLTGMVCAVRGVKSSSTNSKEHGSSISSEHGMNCDKQQQQATQELKSVISSSDDNGSCGMYAASSNIKPIQIFKLCTRPAIEAQMAQVKGLDSKIGYYKSTNGGTEEVNSFIFWVGGGAPDKGSGAESNGSTNGLEGPRARLDLESQPLGLFHPNFGKMTNTRCRRAGQGSTHEKILLPAVRPPRANHVSPASGAHIKN